MKNFNDWLAVKSTLAFGTMWTTYLFIAYGLLPIWFSNKREVILYWSNFIQLFALPLLMVGTNLLGRSAEKRSKETHDAVIRELKEIKEEHKELKKIMQAVCK